MPGAGDYGKPIPWGPLQDPFTVAGDEAWTDYSVATDAHFDSNAPAVVMGRIDSSNVFTDDKAVWPTGYTLRVHPDGAWELLSTEYKKPVVTLASGSIPLDRNQFRIREPVN